MLHFPRYGVDSLASCIHYYCHKLVWKLYDHNSHNLWFIFWYSICVCTFCLWFVWLVSKFVIELLIGVKYTFFFVVSYFLLFILCLISSCILVVEWICLRQKVMYCPVSLIFPKVSSISIYPLFRTIKYTQYQQFLYVSFDLWALLVV